MGSKAELFLMAVAIAALSAWGWFWIAETNWERCALLHECSAPTWPISSSKGG